MKLIRLSSIALTLLIGLGIASCERKYEAPLLTEPEVTLGKEAVITIAKYKEKYAQAPAAGQVIDEDFALRAVVVANDVSGNIYKQIYVQDATGGLSIGIDQYNISGDYPVGQEVVIKLQGLAATSYGGVVQLGVNVNNDPKKTRIPYEIAKRHILKHKWPNAEKAKPKVTTIAAITDAMIGQLIQLEGVYFVQGGEQPFAIKEQTINRELKDKAGNSLMVRNSGYATFANDKLPKGNGTVVGVLSKFGSDYQLFLRTIDDCYGFTGKEPETSGGTTPTPDQPSVASVIYSEAFSTGMGQMSAVSVLGDQGWKVNTQYKNIAASGFANGKTYANEDWLLTPVLDLSAAKSATISFDHTISQGRGKVVDPAKMKAEQTLWVSTDYNGDVKKATWTQLSIPQLPSGKDWTFVNSGEIALPLGQPKVVVAFKYLSSADHSSTWQLKNLKVTSDGGKLASNNITPNPNPEKPTPESGKPTPQDAQLLFPGADFEDWTAFTKSLNSYGLKNYATQVDGGRSGKALQIKGTPAGNDYVFTATALKDSPKRGETITFYVKGTAGKSLSMVVTTADNKPYAFNLDSVGEKGYAVGTGEKEVTLQPVQPKEQDGKISAACSYAQGKIDTKGEWLKITLNIKGLQLATEGNLFALKVGSKVAYQILIDDITIQ